MKRTSIIAAMALVAIVGCSGTPKIDNPVAPDAPPRISLRDEPIGTLPSDDAGYVTISDEEVKENLEREIPVFDELASNQNKPQLQTASHLKESDSADNDLGTATGVVVLVNGEPIFAEDIFEEFQQQLTAAENAVAQKRAPPEKLREFRAMLLRRRLPTHIESKLLSSALMSSLEKKEQRDALEAGLEAMFKQEIAKQKAQRGITSQGEFEVELAKRGLTMSRLRQAFDERSKAQQYVALTAGSQPVFSRKELLEYYREHQDDYAVTGKVRWQQIFVNFAEQGGKSQAYRAISTVRENLIDGVDFSELAREYSDGSTAEEGGLWDWTEMGSLADENIEAALFAMPVGTVSDIMDCTGGCQLIKVVERVDPGHQSFDKVYGEISQTLKAERYRKVANRLIAELKQTAVIESQYNLDAPVKNEKDAPYAMESSVELQ